MRRGSTGFGMKYSGPKERLFTWYAAVGYRLFCQIGNSVYGGDFHFFVDRLGMRIQSTTEDVRETDNIVNLVRIVGTSGCH